MESVKPQTNLIEEDNGQVHEEVQNDAVPLKTIQAKYKNVTPTAFGCLNLWWTHRFLMYFFFLYQYISIVVCVCVRYLTHISCGINTTLFISH